jgi:hypothetical protein
MLRLKAVWLIPLLLAFPAMLPAICPTSTCTPDGTQPSGAKYRICMPDASCWNHKLVVFAHGYVDPNAPIAIPDDQLVVGGVSIPTLINQLGFGFAVSSYSTNGLAVLPGVQDSLDLVNIFSSTVGKPDRLYIVGPSEGGLVTALSIEQHSDVYNAALPACGPIGDFQRQINYIGDFRVVFEYFFPGVIPGSATSVPQEVMNDWDSTYVPSIQNAIQENPSATNQLLAVTKAPIDPNDPSMVAQTVVGLLWYAVFSTNDAKVKLGGQPFDNHDRVYSGSLNDKDLNQKVARFKADPAAAAQIAFHYQTTGKLERPAVTLHTIGDPIIPYWNEPLYSLKTLNQHNFFERVNVPVSAYGHCNFTEGDALLAFGLMLLKDKAAAPVLPSGTEKLIPLDQRHGFLDQARTLGLIQR